MGPRTEADSRFRRQLPKRPQILLGDRSLLTLVDDDISGVWTMKKTFLRTLMAISGLAVLGLTTNVAYANTIEILDPVGGVEEASCSGGSGDCMQGFFENSSTTLSDSKATAYNVLPTETEKKDFLNDLLGDVGESTVTFVNKTDLEGVEFTTDRQYFSFKKGTNTWFFKNLSGGSLTFTLDDISDADDGFSHWTEYGDVATSVVPVPAAVWLFGSALVGLVGLGARRRMQKPAQAG